MKNKIKLILFLIILFIISGCSFKYETDIEITKDKEFNLVIIDAMDDEMIDEIINMYYGSEDKDGNKIEITDTDRWAYLESDEVEEGITRERYEEDGYKGEKYTYATLSLDTISSTSASEKYDIYSDTDMKESVLFIKDGNKYTSNITANPSSSEYLSPVLEYKDSFKEDSLSIKLVINLPSKALSNNADEVTNRGKTLIWNLTDLEERDIEFTFDINADENLIIYVISILTLILLIIYFFYNKHQKDLKR